MKPTPRTEGPAVRYSTRHLPLALFKRLVELGTRMRVTTEHVVNLVVEAGLEKIEATWKSRGGQQQ